MKPSKQMKFVSFLLSRIVLFEELKPYVDFVYNFWFFNVFLCYKTDDKWVDEKQRECLYI